MKIRIFRYSLFLFLLFCFAGSGLAYSLVDYNVDGQVDLADFSVFSNLWLQQNDEPCITDFEQLYEQGLSENYGEDWLASPVVDARCYNSGILNDVTISDALAAIDSAKKTLFIAPGVWQITNSVTIPSNVNLRIESGAILNISSGQKVTIQGPLDAGPCQIFDGQGTVDGKPVCLFMYAQWFGVKGDGITDDSSALQKAFDVCASTQSTLFLTSNLKIKVTQNLYVYGNFDIIGENVNAQIILDGDLDFSDGKHYWINFGVNAKGGTPITYSGKISNIKFKLTANADVNRMLWFHRARDFEVSNCYFDCTDFVTLGLWGYDATPIEGGNNSAWCNAPFRERGRILNNTCVAAQYAVGGEGIGMGVASDITISGNYIYGFADDPIGCHTIDKLTISNNRCYSVTGRILFTNCTNVIVTNNYAQRVPDGVGNLHGAGCLMYTNLESSLSTAPAPSQITITNNQLYIPPGVAQLDGAMVLYGARNVVIANNIIKCDSADAGASGISIKSQSKPGWTDPENLDPAGLAQARDIHITGNSCIGAHPMSIGQYGSDLHGPFYVHGNVAGGYRWYSNTNFGSNSMNPPNPESFHVSGATAIESRLLYEATCSNVTPSSTVIAYRQGGSVSEFYIEKPTRITYIDVVVDTALTAGSVKLKFRKNGGIWQEAYHRIYAPDRHARIYWGDDYTFLNCIEGDSVEIALYGNYDLQPATSINAVTAVYGISY